MCGVWKHFEQIRYICKYVSFTLSCTFLLVCAHLNINIFFDTLQRAVQRSDRTVQSVRLTLAFVALQVPFIHMHCT